MQPTLFAVIYATQAAAEYGVVAARHATSASWEGLQQVVDGAKGYVSTHPLAVGLGAVAIVVLYRLVFSSPRVR